ncbi:hypothetical protein ACA910_014324 [Epithemia clementina (nom. ined.)]
MFASWFFRKLPFLHSNRLHGQSGKVGVRQPCLWSSFHGHFQTDSTAVVCREHWNIEHGSCRCPLADVFTQHASPVQRKIKLKADTLSSSGGAILSTLKDQSTIRQFGGQSLAQLQQPRCISCTTICQLAMKENQSQTPMSPPKNTLEEKRDEKWFKMFEELMKYKKEHGDCVVPVKGDRLGTWVNSQRQNYERYKTIKPERFRLLEGIGFDWAVKKRWNDMYEQLKKYKEKHGHCMVTGKSEGFLGRWVTFQRTQLNRFSQTGKDSKMYSERFQLLNDIGFVWNVRDLRWTRTLEKFKNDFLASKRFPDGKNNEEIKLKRWIDEQWLGYRRFDCGAVANPMTQNRFDRLQEIGFAEYMLEAHWTYRYEKVKALLEDDKNWNPPPNHYLYKWTKKQRDAFHAKRLDKEKVEKLNKIGFPWERRGESKKAKLESSSSATH